MNPRDADAVKLPAIAIIDNQKAVNNEKDLFVYVCVELPVSGLHK